LLLALALLLSFFPQERFLWDRQNPAECHIQPFGGCAAFG
jgi:hypothetical protein